MSTRVTVAGWNPTDLSLLEQCAQELGYTVERTEQQTTIQLAPGSSGQARISPRGDGTHQIRCDNMYLAQVEKLHGEYVYRSALRQGARHGYAVTRTCQQGRTIIRLTRR